MSPISLVLTADLLLCVTRYCAIHYSAQNVGDRDEGLEVIITEDD